MTTAVTQPSNDDIKSLARRYVTDGIAAQQEGWFDQAIALYNRAHALRVIRAAMRDYADTYSY